MSSREQSDITTTMDSVCFLTAKGWVSGTAGANPEDPGGPSNMTGSFIDGTDLRVVVSYPSGNLGSKGYQMTIPSGSILVELPTNNRYNKTLSWDVSMECSGTDHKANGLSTILQYEIQKYGHNTSSGSFLFGFQRLSGSAVQGVDNYGNSGSYVGAIPEDRINPSSPACEWNLVAYLRNTNRST